MNLNQDLKLQINLKDNISRYYLGVASIWLLGVLFFIAFAVLFFFSMNTYNQVELAKDELNTKKSEASYITLAEELAADKVQGYNTILQRLIPETEDYFSIIASLERMSLRTGLKVSRYNLSLPTAGQEKFSLAIVGTVSIEELPRFLNTYKFGTQRLVTIDTIQVTNQPENNVRFTMNFYSKPVTGQNFSKVASLSQDDLTVMDEIIAQILTSESLANGGAGVSEQDSIVPSEIRNSTVLDQ